MLFALAGCVTVENTLTQNDVAGMKLTEVAANVGPGAFIMWEDGLRAYAAAKGAPDDQLMGVRQDARSEGLRSEPRWRLG